MRWSWSYDGAHGAICSPLLVGFVLGCVSCSGLDAADGSDGNDDAGTFSAEVELLEAYGAGLPPSFGFSLAFTFINEDPVDDVAGVNPALANVVLAADDSVLTTIEIEPEDPWDQVVTADSRVEVRFEGMSGSDDLDDGCAQQIYVVVEVPSGDGELTSATSAPVQLVCLAGA